MLEEAFLGNTRVDVLAMAYFIDVTYQPPLVPGEVACP